MKARKRKPRWVDQEAPDRPPPPQTEANRELGTGLTPVNPALLAPYNSYGEPAFVRRGYYLDVAFRCAGCGQEQVWTGRQQKWWYEVAKGYPYSSAKLCRGCRRKERERIAAARQAQQEGALRRSRSASRRRS